MKMTLSEITQGQKAFIKKVLGMYITNNVVVASYRSTEEIHQDADDYVAGMLEGNDFFYLVSYIVDEVIKEPEWVKFLEEEGLEQDSLEQEEWEELFTEVLTDIDHEYLYDERQPVQEIREFKTEFNEECERQVVLRRQKEEEERRQRELEEEMKRAETAEDGDSSTL